MPGRDSASPQLRQSSPAGWSGHHLQTAGSGSPMLAVHFTSLWQSRLFSGSQGASMKRRLFVSFLGLVVFSCAFAGCGSTPKPDVTVTITSPAVPQAIEATRTVSITAYVAVTGGSATTNINWSLSGTGCSGSACGTLTNETETSVTYQAPPLVSADTTVSVTATSAADPSKSASIRITVVAIRVIMHDKRTELAAGLNSNGSFFALFVATPLADPQH